MATYNPFSNLIQSASVSTGVDANLLTSLIQNESSFDPYAESSAGAQGLTQLLPGTAASVGVTDPFNPSQSITGGATYLAQQIQRFGSTFLGLVAYNEGPTALANQLSSGSQPYPAATQYANSVIGGSASSANSGNTIGQQVGQIASGNTNPSNLPTPASVVQNLSPIAWLQNLWASFLTNQVNVATFVAGFIIFVFGLLLLVGGSIANDVLRRTAPIIKLT